ncbi:MAG: M14 family zinc carboxypeptidase [Anaerolineae bacterium]|nr:M14 family zinc carboxypeptidase [Anaerolineae bacterium]
MPRLSARLTAYILCCLLLLFGFTSSGYARLQPEADAELVWISFQTGNDLALLAGRLDIWEVDRDSDQVLAFISGEDAQWLEVAGYRVTPGPAPIQYPKSIPGYDCYRTIDEQNALIDSWVTVHPRLAQTRTIGQSYEGRSLRVLQLTNTETAGDKPVFLLIANIHGRELITNEAALDFAQYLLENYATDPDINWLLDHQVIYILASANPDGHVKNEPGEPWTWWRKNTQPYGTCNPFSYGVDLNRNAAFFWGNASPNPCDELYQGPVAGSEPETAAIAGLLRTLFPDQRGPNADDPAPASATGIFITLHSYGNLVLWPWAALYTPAPNASQLAMIGEKLARFNGYAPNAGSSLYPASGTTLDFAYGELGVASFLFEIGSSLDEFYPPCSRYEELISPNIQAFLYAARIARSPYETAFGPDVSNVRLVPASVNIGDTTVVTITVDDTQNGYLDIAGAELSIDSPPWKMGASTMMTAADGVFDTPVENASASLDTAQLSPGKHMVFLRGRDSSSNWGPVSAAFLEVVSPTFTLVPPAVTGYGKSDEQVLYSLQVTNTSPLSQTYSLTGSVPSWTTNYSPSQFSLSPADGSEVQLTVTIPTIDSLPVNQDEDRFTVSVTTITSPSLTHTAHITTRVLRDHAYLPLIVRVSQ